MNCKYLKNGYFFTLIVVAIAASCSKINSPSDNLSQSQGQKPDESPLSKEIKGFFPHSIEFKGTKIHGQKYAENSNTCKVCHGQDLMGGSSQISCKSCHNYPHPTKWALPLNHGAAYLKEEGRTEEGLVTPPPSTSTWIKCGSCHMNKKPEDSGARQSAGLVDCNSCHTGLPHETTFVEGYHGEIAGKYEGQCTLCHKDYKRFISPSKYGGSCTFCHEGSLEPHHWIKKDDNGHRNPGSIKKHPK